MQTVCIYIGKVCGGIAIDRFGLKKFNTGVLLAIVIGLMSFVYGRESLTWFILTYFIMFCIGGSHDVLVGSTVRVVWGGELMVGLQSWLQLVKPGSQFSAVVWDWGFEAVGYNVFWVFLAVAGGIGW